MCSTRKNTLVIDLSVLPARPDIATVQHFLENQLKLQYSDVLSIQLHHPRNCVLIEMKSYEIALRYQTQHNWKRKMLCADKDFRIPVYVDCDAVTVRVHDLPPSMSHSTVRDYMLKFGEVISIRSETWKHYFPGISNGVRVLRMNLLRDIPSFITIDQQETMITYDKQPKSCRHCEQPAHPGTRCLESSIPNINHTHQNQSAPSHDLFNLEDFPPIGGQQASSPKLPTVEAQHNDDEWTDVDDNTLSSSTDYNETTHKRRRSRRNKEEIETKKCALTSVPQTPVTRTSLIKK